MKVKIRILASIVLVSVLWPAPGTEADVFAARRARVCSYIHGQAVLYSGFDAELGLDKNFYYLSGLAVPNSFLLMDCTTGRDALFIDFDAASLAPEEIARISGIAAIYKRDQVSSFLAEGLTRDRAVYYPFSYSASDPEYLYPDCLVTEQLVGGFPTCLKKNLYSVMAFLRATKDSGEQALIAKAVEITRSGALAGIAAVRPGVYEWEIQQVIEDTFESLGAPRTSFASIIGSGPNSLILHYQDNTRRMEAGEVVVMDVGAEYERYAGDITRTVPVSGEFTPRQREVYDVVLEMQRRVFAAARRGVTLTDLNNVAKEYAVAMGFGDYFNFSGWRHGTCHSLGLDVHDLFHSGYTLAPGMVITVEPGIYFIDALLGPALADPVKAAFLVPEVVARFRGFGGVRIEDDVLVTADGADNLTCVPRDVEEIEAVMAGAAWSPAAGQAAAVGA
jgi:Xaa-Pro aminopeptidase